MGIIINKANGLMIVILLLALIFGFVGVVNGFEKICGHYNSEPNYKTMFKTNECQPNIKPLTCNLLVADMSKCNGFQFNKTKN